MPKTGDAKRLGTAEGALMTRAAHALHAEVPVLDDHWAVHLLGEEHQRLVRDPAHYREHHAPETTAMAPAIAVALGSLRYAEDAVESAVVERDVRQYVCLGAGFDTFALRRTDLTDRLRVFEVDHPDVQKLKRARIELAGRPAPVLPEFVAVDFEKTSLAQSLAESSFSPERAALFSFMNTTTYLSREATGSTLAEIAGLCAVGSRLVVNYLGTVPTTSDQDRLMDQLGASVAAAREPYVSEWTPEEFEALLGQNRFRTLEHVDEKELGKRFFSGRSDGFWPGIPVRLITAERV